MSKSYGPESYKHLQKWPNLTENNLELQWPFGEMFQLDKISHLRKALESKSFQLKEQNAIPTLIGMQKCPEVFKIKNSLTERFTGKGQWNMKHTRGT